VEGLVGRAGAAAAAADQADAQRFAGGHAGLAECFSGEGAGDEASG
jgi:hypothetical protein